jgi:hypothetical protein
LNKFKILRSFLQIFSGGLFQEEKQKFCENNQSEKRIKLARRLADCHHCRRVATAIDPARPLTKASIDILPGKFPKNVAIIFALTSADCSSSSTDKAQIKSGKKIGSSQEEQSVPHSRQIQLWPRSFSNLTLTS